MADAGFFFSLLFPRQVFLYLELGLLAVGSVISLQGVALAESDVSECQPVLSNEPRRRKEKQSTSGREMLAGVGPLWVSGNKCERGPGNVGCQTYATWAGWFSGGELDGFVPCGQCPRQVRERPASRGGMMRKLILPKFFHFG